MVLRSPMYLYLHILETEAPIYALQVSFEDAGI